MTLAEFKKMYITLQRSGGRDFSGEIAKEAVLEMRKTYYTVTMFMDDSCVEGYMCWAFRWARCKGIRADHMLLRSPKLLSGYLSKIRRTSLTPKESNKLFCNTVLKASFQQEMKDLAHEVSKIRTKDIVLSLAVALESKNYNYKKQMTDVITSSLHGDSNAKEVLRSYGMVI